LLFVYSVSGFEFTRESGIFELVGVALYHGWLVDPQNPSYDVVKNYSYNQLVEMVINNVSSQDSKLMQEGKSHSLQIVHLFSIYGKLCGHAFFF